jgi:hypothetical protein
MTLELSTDEAALLADLLDQDFRDLKEEIGKTEAYDYQQLLRARERLLRGLLQKVQQSAPA